MAKRKPSKKSASKRRSKIDPFEKEFFAAFDAWLPEPTLQPKIEYERAKGYSKSVNIHGDKSADQMADILNNIDYSKFDKMYMRGGEPPRGISIVFELIDKNGEKSFYSHTTWTPASQDFIESRRKGLKNFAKEGLEKMNAEYSEYAAIKELEKLIADDELDFDDLLGDEQAEYAVKLDAANITSVTFKFIPRGKS